MNNVVPTLITVTSDVYAFGTEETYPYGRTGGAVPVPEEIRKELQAKPRPARGWSPGALRAVGRGGRSGHCTWFLPATPMVGEAAQMQQETSRRILAEHGFDYAAEFVCGPRAARAVHVMIFNREDPWPTTSWAIRSGARLPTGRNGRCSGLPSFGA